MHWHTKTLKKIGKPGDEAIVYVCHIACTTHSDTHTHAQYHDCTITHQPLVHTLTYTIFCTRTHTHTHTRYTMVFIFFGFSFAVHLLALPLLVPLMWKFKASVSHNAELFWLMALPLLVLVHAVLPGLLCKYRIIIATGYTKSME